MFTYTVKYTESEYDIQNINSLYKTPPKHQNTFEQTRFFQKGNRKCSEPFQTSNFVFYSLYQFHNSYFVIFVTFANVIYSVYCIYFVYFIYMSIWHMDCFGLRRKGVRGGDKVKQFDTCAAAIASRWAITTFVLVVPQLMRIVYTLFCGAACTTSTPIMNQ